MALVSYDICILTPAQVEIDIVGSSLEGGRSLSGLTQAIDLSGGGFVTATYSGITLMTRDQHRYWNAIAGLLNGSVNAIHLPLWTDLLLGDGTDHSGTIDAAPLHATQLSITHDPDELVPGAWFSINHGAVLNHHAYRIISVGTPVSGAYPCEVRPALRAAITAGAGAGFSTPLCAMRLPAGETMPWLFNAPGGYAQDRSINFVEAF